MPNPLMEDCLGELLWEEQCLLTKAVTRKKKNNFYDHLWCCICSSTQSKWYEQSLVLEYEHIATQCKRQVCNYCKKQGPVISECRKWLQNRNDRAYTATAESPSDTSIATVMPIQSTSTLTPEMIQQVIQSAFSALSLSRKSPKTSMWYMDLLMWQSWEYSKLWW